MGRSHVHGVQRDVCQIASRVRSIESSFGRQAPPAPDEKQTKVQPAAQQAQLALDAVDAGRSTSKAVRRLGQKKALLTITHEAATQIKAVVADVRHGCVAFKRPRRS